MLGGALASPASAAPAAASRPAAPPPVSDFRGVNWADPRDNYADDAVVPSGQSTSDSYATTYAKSRAIIGGFSKLGADTVRLPVNPTSVNGPFWTSYRAAIDAATAKGFKVILGYWEADNAKDGKIDDQAPWDRMWARVTSAYARNSKVYFEPMNEPFGYTSQEWRDVAARWVDTHRSVPRDRILVEASSTARTSSPCAPTAASTGPGWPCTTTASDTPTGPASTSGSRTSRSASATAPRAPSSTSSARP
ncbi:cellulase family glycosylhydrolase [Streptomyces sp. NPDC048558]|uniref:cellulase family glycosylhydrolase n=1 Tax=Streptomyces sp. NPDC048558 TaxID=3155759 RepID=UPI003440DAF9